MSATISTNPAVPTLAGPTPPAKRLPLHQYLRTVRRNFIEALDEGMFSAPIIRQGTAINPQELSSLKRFDGRANSESFPRGGSLRRRKPPSPSREMGIQEAPVQFGHAVEVAISVTALHAPSDSRRYVVT